MKLVLAFWAGVVVFMIPIIPGCINRAEQKKETEVVALTLMHNNCFPCHTPDPGIDKRLAPPMFMVRGHYYSDTISKQDFIDKIVRYAQNPSEAISIMPGAIRNFGLMPKQVFKQEDLEVIAGYIYDHDISTDAWYAAWEEFKIQSKPGEKAMTFEERGLTIVNNTKANLVKNLMEAIGTYGTPGAVEFCSLRAMALTDSLAQVYDAKIRRVSDRPRNKANQANENELGYINMLKIKEENKEALPPIIQILDGKMTGYYPILTAKMCLQCHGVEGTDISPATTARIKSFYPDDQATSYGENQLRGLLVAEMN